MKALVGTFNKQKAIVGRGFSGHCDPPATRPPSYLDLHLSQLVRHAAPLGLEVAPARHAALAALGLQRGGAQRHGRGGVARSCAPLQVVRARVQPQQRDIIHLGSVL